MAPWRLIIVVVGIDLAGSPKRDTGFCCFDGKRASAEILHSDDEIIRYTLGARPDLVAIDAPLALPKGRRLGKRHNDIVGSRKIHFRKCDLELRRLRIPFFPITLGPMRMLTVRGIRIMKQLQSAHLKVVETYPGAAQDLWNMPRNRNLTGLLKALRRRGVTGLKKRHGKDELDGVTCAMVAWEHIQGRARIIGDPREALMILPLGTRRHGDTGMG